MYIRARSTAGAGLAEDIQPAPTDPAHSGPAERKRLSGPGLLTFLAIADAWGLSEAQRRAVLGMPARSTYHQWAATARRGDSPTLPLDALLRISAVLGIHQALHMLFVEEAQALQWLRSPNVGPVFGGQAPLDLVVSGTQDGLLQVRRHLDAWRGGTFSAPRPGETAVPLNDADIVWL